MSLRTGFSQVILPQSALVIPATASAGVYHTQLTNLSSGTYIGNYNYAIVANTGGANFVAGGYISLTYYNYYGAPGVPSPIMLTMMECPVLVAGEEFRGTNCFTFTVPVDGVAVYLTATMSTSAGTWQSTTATGVPIDALFNSCSFIKIG